jgi:hypothetical protein
MGTNISVEITTSNIRINDDNIAYIGENLWAVKMCQWFKVSL